jgi:hypothetical protein
MKNNLGRVLFGFLSLTLSLFSSSLADFTLTANKTNPFVKEAIAVTFKTKQTDSSDVMFFFLQPKESPNYKIILLKKSSQELNYHNKEAIFEYLLFPLKSGNIEVDFNFIIKVASDAAVAQVYEGSRDNVKWIETDNTNVTLQPLKLHVKKLQHRVDLVGDFTLSSNIDKKSANAYDNINLTYKLQGIGYDAIKIEPLEKIKGTEIFKDIIKQKNSATKDGYKIQREFNYAIVSEKSFTVPSKKITCYSPKKAKYYSLQTKEYNIDIKPLERSELIDKRDFPKPTSSYTENMKHFFIYLLIFIAGYITAKVKLPLPKRATQNYKDIKESKDAKELLYILMHTYQDKKLERFYAPLEDIVYNKKSAKDFKKIKKEIVKTALSQ